MIDYRNELIGQFNEIRGMINTLEKRKTRYKGLDDGKILVTSCRGVPQYYFRKNGDKKREYIKSARRDMIRLLIQRDYDAHPYITTGISIALTRWTFVGKVMALLFNMLTCTP